MVLNCEPTGLGLSQCPSPCGSSRTFEAGKNTFHSHPYMAIGLVIGWRDLWRSGGRETRLRFPAA